MESEEERLRRALLLWPMPPWGGADCQTNGSTSLNVLRLLTGRVG